MARPKTKSDLLKLGKDNFEKLNNFVNTLGIEEQNEDFPSGTLNRNIGDVLIHVHHWHLMMMNWHKVGMGGKKPDMPAKGYTWKTTPELNLWIWENYNKTSLKEAKKSLNKSYNQVRKLIEGHTNEELFEKKRYNWTGTTSLGAYLVSATSSHYDWALKLIRKQKNENSR